MGHRLPGAQKEIDQLVSTRQRQLERAMAQIRTLEKLTDFHTTHTNSKP